MARQLGSVVTMAVVLLMAAPLSGLAQTPESLLLGGNQLAPHDWVYQLQTELENYKARWHEPWMDLTEAQHEQLLQELAELAEIKKFFNSTNDWQSEEAKRYAKRQDEIRFDRELVKRLREIIGPENELRIVAKINYTTLMGKNARDREAHVTMFSNKKLLELIGLSERQTNQITTVIDAAQRKTERADRDLARDIHDLTMNHWHNVLRELSPQQRAMLEDWHGEPIHWFEIKNGEFLTALAKLKPSPSGGTFKFPRNPTAEAQAVLTELQRKEMSARVFVDNGFEVVDALWFEVMAAKEVHELVGLNPKQQTQLSEEMKHYNDHAVRLTRPINPRLDQLLQNDFTDDQFASFLKPDQLQRFRQVEFQVLTSGEFHSSFGALHPDVQDTLDLDVSTTTKLLDMGEVFKRERQQIIDDFKSKREDERKAAVREIFEVLDDDQIQRFSRITGVPAESLK